MHAALVAAALAVLSTAVAARPAPRGDLRSTIEGLIHESGAERVAVAYRDLGSRDELYLRADETFHAASLMKVPVMLEVFRLVQERKLSLDDRLAVKTQFTSMADGSEFTLSPDDDADRDLYQRAGQTATVGDLTERMVTMSSNLATNLLVERVGADQVTRYMERLGARDVRVLRGVMDDKAFDKGLNNTTTARGMATLLAIIANRRAVSAAASDDLVRILLAQEHNEGIPVGLPAGWRAAHKTGWFTGTSHDAAIVYPPTGKPYILVVLTHGIQDAEKANRLIADISHAVASHRPTTKQ